jgi:hypothetical protein
MITRSSQPPTEVGGWPGSLATPPGRRRASDARRVALTARVASCLATEGVLRKSGSLRREAGGPVATGGEREAARGVNGVGRFASGARYRDIQDRFLSSVGGLRKV